MNSSGDSSNILMRENIMYGSYKDKITRPQIHLIEKEVHFLLFRLSIL